MADFLNKAQLGVSSIPPQRVKDLGSDLMGLFGATDKALQTYNTIGVTAAKLDYQDKERETLGKLTDKMIEADNASARNDTEAMLTIKQDISSITGELNAHKEAYKNHQAAYDAFDDLSSDFGASVRSKYDPMLNNMYIKASKQNYSDGIKETQALYELSGLPIGNKAIDTMITNGAPFGITREEVTGEMVDFNLNNGIANFSADPLTFATRFNLVARDEKGNTTVDDTQIANMVNHLIPQAIYDTETGEVKSTVDGVSDEQRVNISKFIGHIKSAFTKEGSTDTYNAEFRNALANQREMFTNVSNGSQPISSLEERAYIDRMNEFVKAGTLSKSELNMYEQIMVDMRVDKTKIHNANNEFNTAINNKDANTVSRLITGGSKSLGASFYDGAFKRRLVENENAIENARKNGDSNAVARLTVNSQQTALLGSMESKTYKRNDDILTGEVRPTNINEIQESVNMFSIVATEQPSGKIGQSNNISLTKNQAIELADSVAKATEQAKQAYPDSKDTLKRNEFVIKAYTEARAKGVSNYQGLYNGFMDIASGYGFKESVASEERFYWIGDNVQPTVSQLQYFADIAARQGKTAKSPEDVAMIISDNGVRLKIRDTSTLGFGLDIVTLPKLSSPKYGEVDQDILDVIQAHTLKINNIEKFVPKDYEAMVDINQADETEVKLSFRNRKNGTILQGEFISESAMFELLTEEQKKTRIKKMDKNIKKNTVDSTSTISFQ